MALFTKTSGNSIIGTAGDDVIVVVDPAAALIGSIDGAGGNDELRYAGTAGQLLTLGNNIASIESVTIGTGTGSAPNSSGSTAEGIDASAFSSGLSLAGNAGNNSITGTAFDDTIQGNAGDDTLFAGTGNDTLLGGPGHDSLLGAAGNDRLDGGSGADLLNGGAGDDVYVVDDPGDVVTEVPPSQLSVNLVSAAVSGHVANWTSLGPSVSGDGSLVVFWSVATDLIGGDGNGQSDVFARNVAAGTTSLVSAALDGTPGNASSYEPVIASGGRYVAFWSEASNLVTGDTNGVSDVFLRDLQAGTTLRVSTAVDGSQGNLASFSPSLSADGRYVAFASDATDLTPGITGGQNIFVKDMQTGTIVALTDGGYSYAPVIASSGHFVVFESEADNLVADDTNGKQDVFLRDLQSGVTTRVSVASDGSQADGVSSGGSVSADGRYVAFASTAENLAPGDANGASDVFVRDLQAGTTQIISQPGTGGSYSPYVTDDGGHVFFLSDAANLVPGDTNGVTDVFLRDLQSGGITRLAVSAGGSQPNGATDHIAISPDGAYLALSSQATNLVADDDNGWRDVFLLAHPLNLQAGGSDRVESSVSFTLPAGVEDLVLTGSGPISGTGNALDNHLTGNSAANMLVGLQGNDLLDGGSGDDTMIGGVGDDTYFVDSVNDVVDETGISDFPLARVSIATDGTQGDFGSFQAAISADGRYIAFGSNATNLVSGDSNDAKDIFVRDLSTNSIVRVSTATDGTQANGDSFDYAISPDGRFVVFDSLATNLVPGDFNGALDVFLKDLQTGTLVRVSENAQGDLAAGASFAGSVSLDGRYVAFSSVASNLVPDDHNGTMDVFVKDMLSGTVTRVSTPNGGGEPIGLSDHPVISADGRFVAFESTANLVAGETDFANDVFVRDLQTGTLSSVSVTMSGAQAGGFTPVISADGRYVAFASGSPNIVPGDTNSRIDVFVRDTQEGTTVLASLAYDGSQANGVGSTPTGISEDGRFITFDSGATNLVPGVAGEGGFVRDMVTGAIARLGDLADGESSGTERPAISANGHVVAFDTPTSGLVPDDSNGMTDVFARSNPLLAPSGGLDTVNSSVSWTLSPGIEQLTLQGQGNIDGTGNDGDNLLVGNAGDNVLSGGAGADILQGEAGNDVLNGGSGNDFLDGGPGSDRMQGGPGDDRYILDSAGDSVIENAGEGRDIVEVAYLSAGQTYVLPASVEDLDLSGSTGGNATGNDAVNSITGNAGPNSISAGAGNNVLDGGRGADSMAGGPGDDTYEIDFGLDQVTELNGQGNDSVISQVPQVLAANVENLALGDSAGNIEGIGNAANNVIIGNNSANLLDGAAGNDTLKGQGGDDTLLGADGNDNLSGGLGRDVLAGGAGADHFVFDSAIAGGTNVDQIVDFVQGQDVIDLSAAIFAAVGAPGNLAASAFVSEPGAVAHDANQHIVHDTNTGTLYYDADGSRAQPMVAFAQINPGQALAAADLHLIS